VGNRLAEFQGPVIENLVAFLPMHLAYTRVFSPQYNDREDILGPLNARQGEYLLFIGSAISAQ
jgi:hypothetical protein